MIDNSRRAGNLNNIKLRYQSLEVTAALFAGGVLFEIGPELKARYAQIDEDPISLRSIGATACLALFAVGFHAGARDKKKTILNLEESTE